MPVVGFEETTTFRLKAEDYKAINRIVSRNRDIYDNPSHFIRSWIIRGIKHYDEPRRDKQGSDK